MIELQSIFKEIKKFINPLSIDNLSNYIMASNFQTIVALEHDNRRYITFDVKARFSGPQTPESKEYFDKLRGVDPHHWAAYLHTIDIGDFNPRAIPTTAYSQLQKRINFNCTQTFIDKLLCGGERELSNYPGTNPLNKDMPNTYVKSKLYSDYKTSGLEAPFRALATEESFFSDLYSALGGSATEFQGKRLGPKSGPRPRSIDLPPLYEMRKRFAVYLNDPNWFSAEIAQEEEDAV